MKTRAVRSLATWLCLASCALMGLATAPGLVVCIGMDGHLDLNSLAEGCGDCTPVGLGLEDGSAPLGLAAIPATCCPCVDLPLPSGQQPAPRLLSTLSDLRLSAAAPVCLVGSPALVALSPTSLSGFPGDAPASPLTLRRGVVLRF